MLAVLTVIGVAVALGLALVGGPVVVDWSRKRRAEAVERQIALTDALDERLGPVVAPTVRKPLWGPWEVRIAAPFLHPVAMATILAVVEDTFGDIPRLDAQPYRVVLRPQDAGQEARTWGDRLAAA
jgi:hypothetical protein